MHPYVLWRPALDVHPSSCNWNDSPCGGVQGAPQGQPPRTPHQTGPPAPGPTGHHVPQREAQDSLPRGRSLAGCLAAFNLT